MPLSQAIRARPLIPRLGGKRRLARKILALFPEHRCYVEPFAGGGALFFAKEPSKAEVLNDTDGELMNLYRVVKHHPEELARQFDWDLISRQEFERLKRSPPEVLTDVQRAHRLIYLQKLSFGGISHNYSFGISTTRKPPLNLRCIGDEIMAARERLRGATIECCDWKDCVKKYDRKGSFFYLDPPYWHTAGYGKEFPLEEYQAMAFLLGHMNGKALVSLNDHPEMKRTFKGFPRAYIPVTYTAGSGRKGQGSRKRELLIRNF